MTEGYKKFQDRLKDLLSKKDDLARRININKSIIEDYNEKLDLAELNSQTENVKDLKAGIAELEKLTEEMQIAFRAYENNKGALVDHFRKHNLELQQMATNVKVENLRVINQLQAQYDKNLLKLEKVKKEYLSIISNLGADYLQANELSAEIREIKIFIPGEAPDKYYGGLTSDLHDPLHISEIYLSDGAVKRAFCHGVHLGEIYNR